ncbi:MAG: hypothetical protein GX119_00740 [Syntrophomonadaceae bacterium]|jgi:hypothetical protein|nr:hypothetical protein [Syntrophomonadaceae bacterium]
MDYKNSAVKKMMQQDKIDPGGFSFMEPGWWALHATAITAIWVIADRMARSSSERDG